MRKGLGECSGQMFANCSQKVPYTSGSKGRPALTLLGANKRYIAFVYKRRSTSGDSPSMVAYWCSLESAVKYAWLSYIKMAWKSAIQTHGGWYCDSQSVSDSESYSATYSEDLRADFKKVTFVSFASVVLVCPHADTLLKVWRPNASFASRILR